MNKEGINALISDANDDKYVLLYFVHWKEDIENVKKVNLYKKSQSLL